MVVAADGNSLDETTSEEFRSQGEDDQNSADFSNHPSTTQEETFRGLMLVPSSVSAAIKTDFVNPVRLAASVVRPMEN